MPSFDFLHNLDSLPVGPERWRLISAKAPAWFPGEPAQLPAAPSEFLEPPLYGVRFAEAGDLSQGRFLKVVSPGRIGHAVFPRVVTAVRYLNPRFRDDWPEFLDIVRLGAYDFLGLETPIYLDGSPVHADVRWQQP